MIRVMIVKEMKFRGRNRNKRIGVMMIIIMITIIILMIILIAIMIIMMALKSTILFFWHFGVGFFTVLSLSCEQTPTCMLMWWWGVSCATQLCHVVGRDSLVFNFYRAQISFEFTYLLKHLASDRGEDIRVYRENPQ